MTPERKRKIESVLSKRQTDITVVLENVWDPHNISAVMRSCDAVGVQEIYVLATKIQRHTEWNFRSGSSAAKWLTIHQYDAVEECFKRLREKYETVLAAYLHTGSVSLYHTDLTKKCALVFGNEHAGVSDEVRVLTDGNFAIPQVGMIQSLNISVACAVTLYEAFRQKQLAGHYSHQQLSLEEYNLLNKHWSTPHENVK